MNNNISSEFSITEIKKIEKIACKFKNDLRKEYIFYSIVFTVVLIISFWFLYCIYGEFGTDIVINVIFIFGVMYAALLILCAVIAVKTAARNLSFFSYYYALGEIVACENTNVKKETIIAEYGYKSSIRRIVRKIGYNESAQILIAKAENVQFKSLPQAEKKYDSSVVGKEAVIIYYPKPGFSIIVLRNEL